MKPLQKLIRFFQSETVLCIAAVLAVISAFFVKPGPDYLGYIDFRTLVLLFCLMAVVAGLQKGWAFDFLAQKMLTKVHTTRQLVGILVFMCFLLSMFITNDVALLTFVPFSVLILKRVEKQELMIYTVVLQTIAANLGSLLLPVGNPQNLYLYGISKMGFGAFVGCMLPLWLVSGILLAIAVLPVKSQKIEPQGADVPVLRNVALYLILFALCLTTVAGILPYYYLFVIILVTILIKDGRVLISVDYLLLLTFVCFFVFIGNMKNLPAVTAFMKQIIEGKELVMGVLFSQVISNVPAAILLSGFTDQIKALLWGTNIGGLGTLIASLASLISYKIYSRQEGHENGKYMLVFSGMNVLFLVMIGLFAWVFIRFAGR